MRVIRGMHGDRVVYVFSTDQTRGGFAVAADFDLEGIPFGASTARFIHIWHTDTAIPPELTDRPLMRRELVAEHPQILAALDAEHEAQVAEGRAKMEAANRRRARRHGAAPQHALPSPLPAAPTNPTCSAPAPNGHAAPDGWLA
jgi:hypothetical protein